MEEQTARDWYWWLWLSPLVTVPSLVVFGFLVAPPLAVLGSSLWHLILLFAALNQKSEFVCWHGRQALLLAGARTAIALGFVLMFGLSGDLELLAIPILIPVWCFGTLWGQVQAARGNCSLMRWRGLADAQPAVLRAREAAQEAEAEVEADALVEVIRYSHDPEERRKALSKLTELGMVESL